MAQTQEVYLKLAQGVDDVREIVRALVAALVQDGFTDREARVITASVFAGMIEQSKDEEQE